MQKKCVHVEDTPLGSYCCVSKKECFDPFVEECNEPELEYLMKIAEDYMEEEGD